MKTIILTLALFSITLAASAAAKKKADTKAAQPAAPGLEIPKDAVHNADGTFSWTDKDGKKWLYAKTPFGVMRSPADTTPEATQSAVSGTTLKYTKATDNGDTVKFERTTPFGPVVWEKKKTELTADEKSILEYQTAKPTGPNAQ
ncbi:MAG: hypothetical protein M3N54_08620 [Acidobacteriota bacterium]|nr:hypothetical protein [Acidobacteriota bacterium]